MLSEISVLVTQWCLENSKLQTRFQFFLHDLSAEPVPIIEYIPSIQSFSIGLSTYLLSFYIYLQTNPNKQKAVIR